MSPSDIETIVVELAGDTFGVSSNELTLSSSPDSVESWDSIKQLELVMAIEQTFDLVLHPDEVLAILDLSALLQIVKNRLQSK